MKRTLALFLVILLLSACGGQGSGLEAGETVEKAARTVYAMDTVMDLTVYATETAAEASLDAAETEIYRLDDLFSISCETGDIYHINADRTAQVSEETAALLRRALELSEETDGDFDPTVFPLVQLWGFPTGQYRVPSQAEIDEVLPHVGLSQITEISQVGGSQQWTVELAPEGGLDLGGIAKGYTSRRVIETLQAAGVEAAVISLGGNVGTLGTKPDGSPWYVAVENPDGGDYLGILSLEGGYFAITSGGYERYFVEDGVTYHHIIDPKTGYPAETDLLSVTIVTQDGTMADALSTALFVKGFDGAVNFWLKHQDDFGMVLVTAEGIFATEGLEFSTENTYYVLGANG